MRKDFEEDLIRKFFSDVIHDYVIAVKVSAPLQCESAKITREFR